MTIEANIRSAGRRRVYVRSRNALAVWTTAVIAIETIAIAASAYGAFALYNLVAYGVIPSQVGYAWTSIAIAVMYVGLCVADNQYDFQSPEWNQHHRSRGLAAIGLAFAFLLAIKFMSDVLEGYSRGTFIAQLIVALGAQLVTRTILWQVIDQARKQGSWRRASMVVLTLPGAHRANDVQQRIPAQRGELVRRYDLAPAVDDSPSFDRLEAELAEIRRECRALRIETALIVFDADNMGLVTRVVSVFSELPVRIQLLPVGMVDFMQCSRIGNCGPMRVLEVLSGPCSLRDRLLKRSLDLAAAVVLGVLVLPLLALIAMVIKLDSKGPVLFRQTRHGFNNEPIQVLKFRTMTTIEDSPDEFRQAVRNDPRVTRVGRILRRTNLDELPQLFNVLKGEMSIVGPRPHALAHNAMYADRICRMSRRHNVKPGITGWAQVNGFRGETDTIDKMRKRVEMDLYYVDNWSLLFDLKIMIMTVISRNAYANAY